MNNKIEQEINKTLECMGNDFDIQVNPAFAENLNSRIANIQIARGIYRNKAFYPVVIVLLVVLNLAVGLTSFTNKTPSKNTTNNPINVLANEYGISQNNYTNF